MRHADEFAGAGPQNSTVNDRHPLQRPPLGKTCGKNPVKLVAPRLYRHGQLVQMTAVDILDAEGLADVLAVMLQEYGQKFRDRLA